ncbi:MAG: hypothetical protein Q8K36_07205, partial [Alphaproteobacteria bacterium]|nr:hypothetical protein [Alphaproteobacteria bacterium]
MILHIAQFLTFIIMMTCFSQSHAFSLFSSKSPAQKNAEILYNRDFPSSTFGSCTATDGNVNFRNIIANITTAMNGKYHKEYLDLLNKRFNRLNQCNQGNNENFTTNIARACQAADAQKDKIAEVLGAAGGAFTQLCDGAKTKELSRVNKLKAEQLYKQAFPSALVGGCAEGDGRINFVTALDNYRKARTEGFDKEYLQLVEARIKRLEQCNAAGNVNFSQALGASCKRDELVLKNIPSVYDPVMKSLVGVCQKAQDVNRQVGEAKLAEQEFAKLFPSSTLGRCTETDANVNLKQVGDLVRANTQNPDFLNPFKAKIAERLKRLQECAKGDNPNFTKKLAESCARDQAHIPEDWTVTRDLCNLVQNNQHMVEAKNAAILMMKKDYGTSMGACSAGYGQINWQGATQKFKILETLSDPTMPFTAQVKAESGLSNEIITLMETPAVRALVFKEYRDITDAHLQALERCAQNKD